MDVKRVFDEALRLPSDVRAALARELLASLEDQKVDPDREALWAAEIRRRLDAYERGEVTALSADDMLARLGAVVSGETA
jgi:putative addiction module component (TIGR02574 family)